MTHSIPFRLGNSARELQLGRFNAREETIWFGFKGSFEDTGSAVIRLEHALPGALGGGGTSAVNGGVIAAGFDAAFEQSTHWLLSAVT